MSQVDGSCLCGKITLKADVEKFSVGACHCSKCRKWTGGVLFAVDAVNIDIQGEEFLGVYPSSEWGERGFCKNCGSNLFFRMRESGQTILTAGCIDKPIDLVFDHQIFIEEKPSYYEFANETKNITGEELLALYSDK